MEMIWINVENDKCKKTNYLKIGQLFPDFDETEMKFATEMIC